MSQVPKILAFSLPLCRIIIVLRVYFQFSRLPSSNVYDPSFCPLYPTPPPLPPPFSHSLPTSAEPNPLPAQCDNTAQQKGADNKYDAQGNKQI